MALASSTASGDFISAIQNALIEAGMLSDKIVVLDPNTETTTPYDPETDEGGESVPTVVLGPREAYIKAEDIEPTGDAGPGAVPMRYRIQFLPVAGDPVILPGMVVRVLAGARNPAHPHYAFAVLGAPTGSIAALTKLECETSGQLSPIWTAP